jgi:hypothetical protein
MHMGHGMSICVWTSNSQLVKFRYMQYSDFCRNKKEDYTSV